MRPPRISVVLIRKISCRLVENSSRPSVATLQTSLQSLPKLFEQLPLASVPIVLPVANHRPFGFGPRQLSPAFPQMNTEYETDSVGPSTSSEPRSPFAEIGSFRWVRSPHRGESCEFRSRLLGRETPRRHQISELPFPLFLIP